MSHHDEMGIIVRIMPKGEELEIEVPVSMTGNEIVNEIIEHGAAPRNDPEGTPYTYELISKRTNSKIDEQTLAHCDVREGEILYLTPKLVAGKNFS